MIRSISNLFARRDADAAERRAAGPVERGGNRSAPPDAAAAGCLPDCLRLRRARPAGSPANLPSTSASAAPERPSSVQLRQWRAWANVQRHAGTGADCAGAIRRMEAYLAGPSASRRTLDLSGLRLTNLPPNMPATVSRLKLSRNAFTALPANLPPGVQDLVLDWNLIRNLSGPLPSGLTRLSANSNRLRRIPDTLPQSITRLLLNHNEIERLPESLPERLEMLQVRSNRLRELLEDFPQGMTFLDADDNLIERIPETLPDSLQTLRLNHNALQALPQRWPAGLRFLRADDNHIEALPETLFQSLPRRCNVHLRANRLPAGEQARIHAQIATLMVAGVRVPAVELAPPVVLGNFEARPLIVAAAAWHTVEHAPALPAWAGFQDEYGAQAFAGFLGGLATPRNLATPGFREKISAWLVRLAAEPELRAASFSEAIGATETCVDRIGLTLNAMKKLEIEHDVRHGRYDRDLPQLVELARGTFCLDVLQEIATRLARDDPRADEISIFLCLQTELRRTLALPIDVERIRFLELANLEPKHMKHAALEVQRRENADFPAFLAGWTPWLSVIERLDPAFSESATEALIEALGAPFEAALAAQLAPDGLEHDDDARRIAGPGVMAQITADIRRAQTVAFLEQRKQSALLASRW